MEQQQQKQAVLTTAVPSSAFGLAAGNKASSTNTDDKENIDPGMDQPHPAGFSAKQFGDKAGPTKFGRSKGGQGSRAPLTDITSLFMLQPGLPPKQDQKQQPGGAAGQKGLWGPQGDKMALGGSAAAGAAGSAASSSHRLSVMR